MRGWTVAGFVVVMTLSGCSSSGGGPSSSGTATPITPADDGIGTRLVVSGQLLGVGGPAPGAPRSWPGSVSWTGPTHGTVRVHSDGRFALSLPPGRYELTGHSPRYGDSDYLCRAAHPVVVGTHGPLRVDVWCQLM